MLPMIRIGELAHQSQVSRDTLRFYEKHGLITPSARTDAGYRLYAESDIKRIGFIVSAKKVGFTLNEIQQLLQLEVTKDIKSCQDVKEFVDHKIQLVNQQRQPNNHCEHEQQRQQQKNQYDPRGAAIAAHLKSIHERIP